MYPLSVTYYCCWRKSNCVLINHGVLFQFDEDMRLRFLSKDPKCVAVIGLNPTKYITLLLYLLVPGLPQNAAGHGYISEFYDQPSEI